MNGKYIADLDAKQYALDHATCLVKDLGLSSPEQVVDAAERFYLFLVTA